MKISSLFFLILFFLVVGCSSDDGPQTQPCTEQTWFQDSDGDGFGDPNSTRSACERPNGFVANSDDCDDDNGNFTTECTCESAGLCGNYPQCGEQPTWFEDADGDGLGNPDVSTTACEQPDGYVSNSNDDFDGGTIWSGASMTFTRAANVDWTLPENQDKITDNVIITRANRMGIFNIATENAFSSSVSPADTEWAFGTTANINSLDFKNWRATIANNAPGAVGQDMVVHLITENIYIDIQFTSWGQGDAGGGAFTYERSTP